MVDVLVAGAAGNTGQPLMEELHRAGASVRAMVRRPDDAVPGNPEKVVADFDDAGSVRTALRGARRAYLVTPSSERAEERQRSFVDAAREAGVERLVLLSQLGAQVDSPVRFLRYHAAVEEHVRRSGIEFTFLRPNLYFQGLFAVAASIAEQGVLAAPIGNAVVSAVDVRDIAAVAAAALTQDAHRHAIYTITGPRAITHADMAGAIAEATGKEVRFLDTAPDDFAAALRGVLPVWQVEGLLEDYAHYRRGEASEVTHVVEEVAGRHAIRFEQFANDYADRFTRT
ncbi:MAG: NmrA family NAD(P)-binding protein [Candidatus Dormibacteraceae bacterium]